MSTIHNKVQISAAVLLLLAGCGGGGGTSPTAVSPSPTAPAASGSTGTAGSTATTGSTGTTTDTGSTSADSAALADANAKLAAAQASNQAAAEAANKAAADKATAERLLAQQEATSRLAAEREAAARADADKAAAAKAAAEQAAAQKVAAAEAAARAATQAKEEAEKALEAERAAAAQRAAEAEAIARKAAEEREAAEREAAEKAAADKAAAQKAAEEKAAAEKAAEAEAAAREEAAKQIEAARKAQADKDAAEKAQKEAEDKKKQQEAEVEDKKKQEEADKAKDGTINRPQLQAPTDAWGGGGVNGYVLATMLDQRTDDAPSADERQAKATAYPDHADATNVISSQIRSVDYAGQGGSGGPLGSYSPVVGFYEYSTFNGTAIGGNAAYKPNPIGAGLQIESTETELKLSNTLQATDKEGENYKAAPIFAASQVQVFPKGERFKFGHVLSQWTTSSGHVVILQLRTSGQQQAQLCWDFKLPDTNRLYCNNWEVPLDWQPGQPLVHLGYTIEDTKDGVTRNWKTQ